MTTKHPTHDPQHIKRITQKIIGLPTLPTVVSKMIELVDNPKTSTTALAHLVETDQALTARILKIANSAYYGFSREVTTVNMAIVIMGFYAVREMGLSLSVFDVFKDIKTMALFDANEFWRHSIGTGVATKVLAKRYYPAKAGEAFVAGLLHDIGKIIINQYFNREFVLIMNRAREEKLPLEAIESDIFGADHGKIGGWLSDKWRLPVTISESIKYHHSPMQSRKDPLLVALVHTADYLCHTSGVGSSGRGVPAELDERIIPLLNQNHCFITSDTLDDLLNAVLVEMDKVISLNTILFENNG